MLASKVHPQRQCVEVELGRHGRHWRSRLEDGTDMKLGFNHVNWFAYQV